jgi:type 1 glutamine amidotransferase
MPPKRALFIAGGWSGHVPEQCAGIFSDELKAAGFITRIETTLDHLAEAEELKTYDVIVPCWTMGQLTPEQSKGLIEAVRSGVGLAGFHGGMGDAFRGNLNYEWMVGGHFVGHPYVGDYTVNIRDTSHVITAGLPVSFAYKSEQYYLLVDPGVHILADTAYTYEDRTVIMPVAWAKHWGKGRVFYSALGHAPSEFTDFPVARTLTTQGLLWAARAI